jgi:hypothetical protein
MLKMVKLLKPLFSSFCLLGRGGGWEVLQVVKLKDPRFLERTIACQSFLDASAFAVEKLSDLSLWQRHAGFSSAAKH